MKFLYPTLEFTVQNAYSWMSYGSMIIGVFIILFPTICPKTFGGWFVYGKSVTNFKTSHVIYVPKRWMAHFYMLATTLTSLVTWNVYKVYFRHDKASSSLQNFIRILSPAGHHATVSPESVVIAVFLLLCHLFRRLYESLFINVTNSKMNVFHYIVGHLYYLGMSFSLLAEAPGFAPSVKGNVEPETISTSGAWLSWNHVIGLLLYLYGNYVEASSHLILKKVREKKNGEENNSKYGIPHGGLFDLVSVPNYLAEILIYIGVYVIFAAKNSTWGSVLLFVIANQVLLAYMTHDWYKKNFPNYPKNRRAIIPYLL